MRGVFATVGVVVVGTFVIMAIVREAGSDPMVLVLCAVAAAMTLVGVRAMGPRAALRRSLRGEGVRVEFAENQDDDDEPPEVWATRLYIELADVLELMRAAAGSEGPPKSVAANCPPYPWLFEVDIRRAAGDVRDAVTVKLILSTERSGGERLWMDVRSRATSDGTLACVIALRPVP